MKLIDFGINEDVVLYDFKNILPSFLFRSVKRCNYTILPMEIETEFTLLQPYTDIDILKFHDYTATKFIYTDRGIPKFHDYTATNFIKDRLDFDIWRIGSHTNPNIDLGLLSTSNIGILSTSNIDMLSTVDTILLTNADIIADIFSTVDTITFSTVDTTLYTAIDIDADMLSVLDSNILSTVNTTLYSKVSSATILSTVRPTFLAILDASILSTVDTILFSNIDITATLISTVDTILFSNIDIAATLYSMINGNILSNVEPTLFSNVDITATLESTVDADVSEVPGLIFLQDIDNLRYHLSSNLTLDQNLDFTKDSSYDHTDPDWQAKKIAWTTGSGWKPIGIGVSSYSGIFNGDSYYLKNLMVNRPGTNAALFIGLSEATIMKTEFINVNINGFASGAIVSNIISGDNNINNCYATGSVTGVMRAGGLVGSMFIANTVKDCYSATTINIIGGLDSSSGGLIGKVFE